MDLLGVPYPRHALWPSTVRDTDRLATDSAAHCLRVRIWSIQTLISAHSFDTNLCRQASLWLDQHAPLMLALERGNPTLEEGILVKALDPCANLPIRPILPSESIWLLPMLWSQKNQSFLSKNPILKLLWKAAPRKSHSNDVSKMIRGLMETSAEHAKTILSIYRCSILGNYGHSRTRPPLPLRFRAYRMDVRDQFQQAVSKHPFMLYALKECLVSCVRDDFGLRAALSGSDWLQFENRVVYCSDRVLRPYAAVSESISARLLLTHGKNATLSQSAVGSSQKQAAAFLKSLGVPGSEVQPVQTAQVLGYPMFGVPEERWNDAHSRNAVDEMRHLIADNVLNPQPPLAVIPLPLQITTLQQKHACPGSHEIYICRGCRSGFFVGHNIGGKKKEALGDALTASWYCPSCDPIAFPQPLVKVSTVGKIVFCANGIHSCCTGCGKPTFYLSEGIECGQCRAARSEEQQKIREAEKNSCWYVACARKCVTCFDVVPKDGVDDGGTWDKYYSCPLHSLPPHTVELPIPAEDVRRTWFAWKTGRQS